jgi:hypothetical protein
MSLDYAKLVLMGWLVIAGCCLSGETEADSSGRVDEVPLKFPVDVQTFDDGRMPLAELFAAWTRLLEQGWKLDVITHSQPAGTTASLPVVAIRSPVSGTATWILAGIHGEEPAGPIAVAASIDHIARLGERRAVVLLPLLNPHGYARNWRYLNIPAWSEEVEGQSVGDSSHLLPDPANPGGARAPASSAEAQAITQYILDMIRRYPPRYSIDLHEDSLIDAGYVYSQGMLGVDEPLAAIAVQILEEAGITIKMSGQTRFGEDISMGIIGPVADSSIDELMSSAQVLVEGRIQPGPRAETVLVFETPAADLTLARRVAAHSALIRRLATLIGQQ